MKIAFIMLCHKNSEQINRFIEKLEKFDCEIFIHCDMKNIEIREKIVHASNIHILSEQDSFDIKWGGTEMVSATLSLLRNVVDFSESTKVKFDYVWLLSGQDYIIQTPQNIITEMAKNKKINYLNITPNNSKKYLSYLKRCDIKYFNPNWITKNNFLVKVIKNIYMIITGGRHHTFKIFKRRKPFEGEFYFGSQWWTLTWECINYILNYCNENKNYIKFFNNTIVPDECFFQTIVMNSPFKNTVKDNLTFVNWGKNNRSPELITKSQLSEILKNNNKYYFARKFDISIDKSVIDKIDEELEI